ncbi:MAG: MFS transporter [Chloroflexota bacterium]|nr:MFS transporter [Chloroflexota bacterium]
MGLKQKVAGDGEGSRPAAPLAPDGPAPETAPAEMLPTRGAEAGRRRGGALDAFASRPFALFWSTIVLSLTGVWIRITAQGYLVYDLTNDEFLLGLVTFCQAAPVLIASPLAGAVLDRVDRRRVLLLVQIIQGTSVLVLAILTSAGTVRVWHIMVIAVVVGTASGFDWPARLSFMPTLVPREHLRSAVAWNSAAFNGSRVVGPVIAGFVIALVGVAACFYLTAALYLPFVLVLATLTVDRSLPDSPRTAGAFRDLLDGYRYIWRNGTIRSLLGVDIVPLMFGITYFTLAPAVARDVLGLGGRGLGVLLAINGVGSLAGTLGVALVLGRVRRRGRIVVAGVGCFGVVLVLFALSGNVLLSAGLILLLGLVVAIYGTLNDTLVQTLVDDAYRGRVLAVYSMFWGLTPIGALEAGFLANRIGVQAALAINGVLVLSYVPLLLRYTPLRSLD